MAAPNTGKLYSDEITAVQRRGVNTSKQVGDKFVPDGAPPLVNENDRKTGEISKSATDGLENWGLGVH